MDGHSGRSDLLTLGFHKIGEPGPEGWRTWFYISEETFAAQLTTLRDFGCTVIDVARFVRHLREQEALPERPVLLTFDDGYRSMLTAALPHLLAMAYPGVLFVPTAYIGGANDFDFGQEPREAICDWEDLRALSDHGVSVQSHSVLHKRFSSLDPAERQSELADSRSVLERGLGLPVELFAYPFGDCGNPPEVAADEARAAGYVAAFLYGDGAVSSPEDALRLPRVAMGPSTDLHEILAKREWT